MQVQAYYHKKTGLLFLEKNEYKAHLCAYNARKKIMNDREVRMNNIKEIIEQTKFNYGSVESALDFIFENFIDIAEYLLFENEKYLGTRLQKIYLRKEIRKIKVLSIECNGFEILRTIKFRNTQKLGWSGNVKMVFSHAIPSSLSISSMLSAIGIETGCGGSGDGIKYSYDVIFYEDTWQNLAIMSKMRNGNAKNDVCFEYEDEDY